jgi:alpha-D-ribose 1-methylphosphonate 5-triphosphate synthase subunit PhnH
MILQPTKKYSFDTVFDSQKVFRLILDAMSNPMRVVNIKEYSDKLHGDHPVFLAVAMTLLDNEVSFHEGEDNSLTDEIASLTLAKREDIKEADFIFVINPDGVEQAIKNAKCGTLSDPHKSATIIIQNDGVPVCRLTFTGPGINGKVEAQVTQTVNDAIIARDAQYFEYPQGIDLIFVSSEGELFAIPRLTEMEVG